MGVAVGDAVGVQVGDVIGALVEDEVGVAVGAILQSRYMQTLACASMDGVSVCTTKTSKTSCTNWCGFVEAWAFEF